jgi:hypothetical protein
MKRIECNNGNFIERFYDRRTKSSVTKLVDKLGNQIKDAEYDGNKLSADFSLKMMIKDNGGIKLI